MREAPRVMMADKLTRYGPHPRAELVEENAAVLDTRVRDGSPVLFPASHETSGARGWSLPPPRAALQRTAHPGGLIHGEADEDRECPGPGSPAAGRGRRGGGDQERRRE